uniref:glutathione transferase n=1 Tax=Leersia perrieri TaxID=77586 RepID=A0A0D9V122_9ORYZ
MSPPVKVFGHAISTNVSRVLVCLEEVGAEYELVTVNFLAGEQNSPEHVERNPFGKIPAMQDGDLVLFANTNLSITTFSESRAIAKYILRKYKSSEVDLLRESNISEAALVDVWTEVEAHQYYPAISPIVYECIIFPVMRGVATNQRAVDESLEKLRAVLETYEARLSGSRYLAGDFFSFADLNHFPFTYYFMATPYASVFDAYPRVKAWWEDLVLRPSIKKISANMPTKF